MPLPIAMVHDDLVFVDDLNEPDGHHLDQEALNGLGPAERAQVIAASKRLREAALSEWAAKIQEAIGTSVGWQKP